MRTAVLDSIGRFFWIKQRGASR